MVNQKEKVLCINRNKLPISWVEKTSIIPLGVDEFIAQCTKSGFEFVDRSKAEKDRSLKQIIPYIVLQSLDLGQTAIYNRQGSETRLHDLWSLGIGGHINPIDSSTARTSFKEILISGYTRELEEELVKRPLQDQPQFAGIISEDITDVGSVHLGAVFRILTQTPSDYIPGSELFQFQWKKTDQLKNLNMELWSELALTLLAFDQR